MRLLRFFISRSLLIASATAFQTHGTISHSVSQVHDGIHSLTTGGPLAVAKTTAHKFGLPRKQPLQEQKRLSTQLSVAPIMDSTFASAAVILFVLSSFFRNAGRAMKQRNAWEERLEEQGRRPDETDLEYMRRLSAMSYSEYGDSESIFEPTQAEKRRAIQWRNRRFLVKPQGSQTDHDQDDNQSPQIITPTMTPEEIQNFEQTFSIPYDPFYDEPYEESDLPQDVPYIIVKAHCGDAFYETGEIFFKDNKTGLFYRQGSKPRMRNVGFFFFSE